MKTANLLTLLAVVGSLGTAEAAWTRLPSSSPRPIDLASDSLPSTSVVSSEKIGEPEALLSDDPIKRSTLSTGKSGVTIQLINQQLVDSVVFVNNGAAGVLTMSGSTTLTGDWISLGQTTFSSSDSNVSVQFAGAQVKYIRLSFDVSKTGSVASLSITGTATSPVLEKKADSTSSSSSKSVSVNLASAFGGAKAIYAHPTPSNLGEKEYQVNVIKFPKSSEKYQTIIYDLGVVRVLKEFSTAFTKRPTRLEVYAFKDLPETKDWRGKLTLDPAIFVQNAPVASGNDASGLGRLKLVPSQPVSARYIALRFEPNFQAASNESSDSVMDLVELMVGSEDGTFIQSGSGSGGEVSTVNIGGNISQAEMDAITNSLTSNNTDNSDSSSNSDSSDTSDDTSDPGEIVGDNTPTSGAVGGVPVNNRGSSGGAGGAGSGSGTTDTDNSDSNDGPTINFNGGGGGSGGGNNGGGGTGGTDDDDEEPVSAGA